MKSTEAKGRLFGAWGRGRVASPLDACVAFQRRLLAAYSNVADGRARCWRASVDCCKHRHKHTRQKRGANRNLLAAFLLKPNPFQPKKGVRPEPLSLAICQRAASAIRCRSRAGPSTTLYIAPVRVKVSKRGHTAPYQPPLWSVGYTLRWSRPPAIEAPLAFRHAAPRQKDI